MLRIFNLSRLIPDLSFNLHNLRQQEQGLKPLDLLGLKPATLRQTTHEGSNLLFCFILTIISEIAILKAFQMISVNFFS